MSIVITAASGQLGRLVVQDLLRRGVAPADVVAGARSLDSIKDLAEMGVRTAVLDYDQPDTVGAAVDAGDALVLISGNDLANRDRQHADAIAAAKSAGAGHLVYTSGLRASESPSPIAASHAVTEAAVRRSGIPFTLLRNGWYTENYAHSVPAVRESGDTAWSYDDLAAALAEIVGRDVIHQSLSPEQHLQSLIGAGVPEPMAQMAVGADAGIAAGAFAYANGDLARLLGRPSTPLLEGLRALA